MIAFPLKSQNLIIRPFEPADENKLGAFLEQTAPEHLKADAYNSAQRLIAYCEEETKGQAPERLTVGIFRKSDKDVIGRFYAEASKEKPGEWSIAGLTLKDRVHYTVEFFETLMPYLEKRVKVKFLLASAKRTGWEARDQLERSGFQPDKIDLGRPYYKKELFPAVLKVV